MLYFYFVLSVIILFAADRIYPFLQTANAIWLVPLLLLGMMLGFVLIHLLVLVVSILVVNLDKESEKGNKYYRKLINCTLPMLFTLCRIKVHVTGKELIPENEKVLLVSNHFNDVDPVMFLKEFPELELGFIAKKEVYTDLKFVAKAMKKLYCLPIDRENNREAIKTILKAVSYIKEGKASIGIFPEGYTSLDIKLHEFRNGAFKIATKANASIVVCTLVNTEKVFRNLIRKRTDVYLDVVKVISKEEVAQMHTDKIGEIVHAAMKENIEKRQKEIK